MGTKRVIDVENKTRKKIRKYKTVDNLKVKEESDNENSNSELFHVIQNKFEHKEVTKDVENKIRKKIRKNKIADNLKVKEESDNENSNLEPFHAIQIKSDHKEVKKDVENKIRKNKTADNLKIKEDSDNENSNSEPFHGIQNKSEYEEVMKDYVVKENEQEISSVKKISQKKLIKLEKIKSRKKSSLATKSLTSEQRTIFVGNVNINATRNEVKQFFRKYGKIEAVRFRGITPKSENISKKEAIAKKLIHPQRKSFYAYVRFEENSSVDKALEANGKIFKNYHIHVDRAIPSTHKDKNCVFVGNLPWEVNEEELWQLFGSCGKVTNVRVVRSYTTGAGKGFGFVSFESADGVQLALHLNGKKFMERELRVKKTAKKVKVKNQTKNAAQSEKRKPGSKLFSKVKRTRRPMDVSFLKNDKPKFLERDTEGKRRKRKKLDHNMEKEAKPSNFKGVKAVKDGKVLKKGKRRINKAEQKKRILAKKLLNT